MTNPEKAKEYYPIKALEVPDPRPLPKNPTDAIPGSKEKIRVYQKRVRENTQLFHPDDLSWITTGEEYGELSSYEKSSP